MNISLLYTGCRLGDHSRITCYGKGGNTALSYHRWFSYIENMYDRESWSRKKMMESVIIVRKSYRRWSLHKTKYFRGACGVKGFIRRNYMYRNF